MQKIKQRQLKKVLKNDNLERYKAVSSPVLLEETFVVGTAGGRSMWAVSKEFGTRYANKLSTDS